MLKNNKVRSLIIGFFSFLFFLILLSGETQIIFSSEKVGGWVRSAISEADLKNIEIDFSSARTTWTGSFRYPFGIKLNNVVIKKDDDCKSIKADIKSLVVPFAVFAALKEQIKIGVIRLNTGEITTYKTCLSRENNESESSASQVDSFENEIVKVFSDFQKVKVPSKKDFSISGLLFSDFLIYSGVRAGKAFNFIINRLKVGIIANDKYESQWQGVYEVKVTDEKTHKIKFKGTTDIDNEKLVLKMEGRKKEGIFSLNLKSPFWQKDKDDNSKDKKPFMSFSLEYFPLSSLADIFGFELKLPEKKQRASWMDCQISASLNERKIQVKSPLCFVKGAIGSYKVVSGTDFEWTQKTNEWVFNKSVDIKIEDVSLQDIYPFFGRRGPDGIFGEFGKLNVDLGLMSFDSAYAEFELKDFSILFRSKGVSSYQKGKSARGTGAIVTKEKIDFSIEEMDLEAGEFEGSINGTFDLSKGELDVGFEIPHLVLNPAIGKKLFQVDLGFFELEGEGKFNYKKSIQDVRLKLGFDQINSTNWSLGKTKVPCVLLNKSLDCSFEVETLSLSDKVLKKLDLKKQSYNSLKGELDYYKRKLNLIAFSAKEQSQKSDPLLKVKWTTDEGLEGAILDSGSSYKELNFRGFN